MHTNKITWRIGILFLITHINSYATEAGFYTGVQAGMTNTHNTAQSIETISLSNIIVLPPNVIFVPGTATVNPDNKGIGERLFIGYNFNKFFALESGFTHYSPSTYDVSSLSPPSISNPVGKPAIQENGFDFVGKGTYPIEKLGLFGKAGIAIIRTSLAGTLTTTYTFTTNITQQVTVNRTVQTGTTNYVRPTAALGISYDFTPNWVAELTCSRVFGGGGFNSADLYSLGFSYHFVDKFCGQFLC